MRLQYSPLPVEQQIAILYVGTNGLLKDVPIDKVSDFEKNFLLTLQNTHQTDVLDILKQGIINDEVIAILKHSYSTSCRIH